MHSDLWWSLLQQHQESLQHQVGEARPDGDVVQQTLNVIHHHTAELRLISIIEHLKPGEAGRETEANDAQGRRKQTEESEVKRKERKK